MGSYSNNRRITPETSRYINTENFPQNDIAVGTKAIDGSSDTIYYWNGSAWMQLETQDAEIPTFSLAGPVGSVNTSQSFDITLTVTNLEPDTLIPYSYNTISELGSSTPITGNFTNNETGGRVVTISNIVIEDVDSVTLVFSLTNGQASLEITVLAVTLQSAVYKFGDITFDNGADTWTVPEGVTSISVATLGAGAVGREIGGGDVGGGGGALAYTNNITVTPGDVFSVYAPPRGSFLTTVTNHDNFRARFTNSSGTDIVMAENGYMYEVAVERSLFPQTRGRASASIGDVKYDGYNGKASGFIAYGGSAAGWAGSNTQGSSSSYANGRGGYGISPTGLSNQSPPTNSNSGANYGGGGGGKSPNAYQGASDTGYGVGGAGFVRILWPGTDRQFPNDQNFTSTNRELTMTSEDTVESFSNYTVTVFASYVQSNYSAEVTLTGLPGGELSRNFVQPSFSATNRTITFNFVIPEVTADASVTVAYTEFNQPQPIMSYVITATPKTKYLLDFSGANLSTNTDIVTFIESQGFIATIDGQNITVEDDALNITTAAAINIEYENGDAVIDNTAGTVDRWEVAFYCKTTQTVGGNANGIISSINYNTTSGFGAAMDGAFVGRASQNTRYFSGGSNPAWILGDGQWHHYKIRRRAALNNYYLYRDEALVDFFEDIYANINLLPFTIGNRYTPLDQNFYSSNFSIADIQVNTNDYFTLAEYAVQPPDTIFVTNASGGSTFYFSGRTLLEILSNEPNTAFALEPYRKYIFDVDLTANTAVTMTFRIDDARGFEEQENIINNSTNLGKITWTPEPGRYNWRAYDRMQGIYAKEITSFFEDLNPKFKELSKDGAGNWNTSYLGGTNGYQFNLTGSTNGLGLYTWYPILQMGSGSIIKNNGQTERVDMLFCQIDTLNSNGQGIGLFNKNLVDTASTYDDVIDAPNNPPIFGQINNYATFDYSGGGNKEHWILIDVSSAAMYIFHFSSTLTFAGYWDLTPGDWVLGINKNSTGATPPDFLVRTFSTYWTRDPYDLLFSLNNLRNDGKLGSHYDD